MFLCWILCHHQTDLYQCPLWVRSGGIIFFHQTQFTVDTSTSGSGGHTGTDTEIERFSSDFYVESCMTARPTFKNAHCVFGLAHTSPAPADQSTRASASTGGSGGNTDSNIEMRRKSYHFYVGSCAITRPTCTSVHCGPCLDFPLKSDGFL